MINTRISCHLPISCRSRGIVNNKPSYSFDIYWYIGQTEKIYREHYNLVLADIKILVRVGRYLSLSTRNVPWKCVKIWTNLFLFSLLLQYAYLINVLYWKEKKKKRKRLVAMMLLVIRSLSNSRNDCLE